MQETHFLWLRIDYNGYYIYVCIYIYMYIRISEYDAIYRSKPRITVHSIVISFNVVQNTAKKE